MANYITVSALNNYLRRKFEADVHLDRVFLKGEISNCKVHSRGHIYFSLKDETSVINAIMFARDADGLSFEPTDGTKVFAEGKVTVYEASGKYQIIVSKMQPDGIGELYIAYEKLKAKLEAEGLFKKEFKKRLPRFPRKIGIITAPTGAAIRDILSTIKRRFPICETILFPALVQGENAKYSVVENINLAQNYDLDVLIVGRGGGSIEDLWAFNEEIVARAIFDSKIPVISAVGHEVDFTIADFVADLRAPTPTGAAEMAVPNIMDVMRNIENFKIRLRESTNSKLNIERKQLDSLKNSYIFKNPTTIYEVKEQKLSLLIDKMRETLQLKLKEATVKIENLKNSYVLKNPLGIYEKNWTKIDFYRSRIKYLLDNRLSLEQSHFDRIKANRIFKEPLSILKEKTNDYVHVCNKLELLNPLGILNKGYSVVIKDSVAVKSVDDLTIGDNVIIRFKDGNIEANVKEITKENE